MLDRQPLSIALTGGPSGGKSTLQKAIGECIPEVYCMPEVATILLSGGFPAPTEAHPWDPEWQRAFQATVAAGQLALEEISRQRAIREGKLIVTFDRGLLDGAAYLPRGVQELEELAGLSEQSMLDNYDLVLHLTSSATHDAYDKLSNPHRFEEAEEALRLEQQILAVWQNHPNRTILDDKDKDVRINRGLEIISAQLGAG